MACVEISSESIKCCIIDDLVGVKMVCSGKWNLMIQSGFSDYRDAGVEDVSE